MGTSEQWPLHHFTNNILNYKTTTLGTNYNYIIYESIRALRTNGNTITIQWIPADEESKLWDIAKSNAKQATREGATPETHMPRMRSTTLNIAQFKRGTTDHLPDKVGAYSKRVDAALPGDHTRLLYEHLSRKEAGVLAQLRTGMARLNGYLHCIEAALLDQCGCRRARETVDYFLFRCKKWTTYRTEMLNCRHLQKQYFLLPRREIAIGWKRLDS